MNKKKTCRPSKITLSSIAAFSIVLAIMAINLCYGLSLNDDRGTFGDMFGAANALFTGLALAALGLSIWMQREEVRITKEDAKRTKTILDEQQKITKAQQAAIQRQNFESIFFQSLRLLTDTVNNIDLNSKDKESENGKDVFKIFVQRMYGGMGTSGRIAREAQSERSRRKLHNDQTGIPPKIKSEEIYQELFERNENDLAHYFRILYNVMNIIDKSEINNKTQYSKLVRAQLSSDELVLLYLNGLSPRGKNFKVLIERHALLKHVNRNNVLVEEAGGTYADSAFDDYLEGTLQSEEINKDECNLSL